ERRISAMLTRRTLLQSSVLGLTAAATSAWWIKQSHATDVFEVTHSDADWRKLLTPAQYAVLRQSATERPFTSPLLNEHRPGIFACVGCDHGLFSSETKFDSGTGWP